jgi:hypothetical protein
VSSSHYDPPSVLQPCKRSLSIRSAASSAPLFTSPLYINRLYAIIHTIKFLCFGSHQRSYKSLPSAALSSFGSALSSFGSALSSYGSLLLLLQLFSFCGSFLPLLPPSAAAFSSSNSHHQPHCPLAPYSMQEDRQYQIGRRGGIWQ